MCLVDAWRVHILVEVSEGYKLGHLNVVYDSFKSSLHWLLSRYQ